MALRCDGCNFWHPTGPRHETGECRVRPPRRVYSRDLDRSLTDAPPVTHAYFWCGEHSGFGEVVEALTDAA